MEAIISILNGVFIKTVDDMEDRNIGFLMEYKQYIYAVCTAVFTLFLYNDVNIALFILLIFAPISYFVGSIDKPIWKALFPVTVLVLLLKMNTIQYNGMFDILEKFIIVIIASAYIFIVAVVFPEEKSNKKTVFRFSQFVMFLFLSFMIPPFLSNKGTIQSLFLSNFGYFFTSVLFDTVLKQDGEEDGDGAEKKDAGLNKLE